MGQPLFILLLDRGALDGALTPLSGLCEKGYLAIPELLIASNKFEGYTPDQLKKIIHSCVADHHTDSTSTMSYCMTCYQCYKYLDDPNYTVDVQKQSAIERGQEEKERQIKILVSLFVSQTKNYPECSLQGDLWDTVSRYLPRDWLGQ